MLHRIGILPVVQKVVLELRWMTPIYMRIFAFAIRMAIMSTIILSMLKRKFNTLGAVVTYAQTARDDTE